MVKSCIFCELSNSKQDIILDSPNCFVVLDKYPNEIGHMLVISKRHTIDMVSTDDALISEMFLMAKRMVNVAKERLGASGANIQTNIGKDAGQYVFHFHVHVIPRYAIKHSTQKELDEASKTELISKLR